MFKKSNYFEKNDSPLKIVLIYAIIILGCFLTVYPILNVFSVSLRPGSSLYSTSLAIFPDLDKLKWVDIASSKSGDFMLSAANRSYLFLSQTKGDSWKEITQLNVKGSEVDGDLNWQSATISDDGSVAIVAEEGRRATDKGAAYITRDKGASWEEVRNPDGKWQKVSLSGDGKHLYSIVRRRLNYHLVYSADMGATWSEVVLKDKPDSIVCSSIAVSYDGSVAILGTREDSVYVSENFGQKTRALAALGKKIWVDVAVSADGSKFIAAAHNEPLQISKDSGKTWIADATIGPKDWKAVSASGERVVAAFGDNHYAFSRDFGSAWETGEIEKNAGISDAILIGDTDRMVLVQDNGYIFAGEGKSLSRIDGYTRKIHYFDNYVKAFTKYDVGQWLLNSFIVAVISTLAGVILAVTAGYAFSRYVFKGREIGLSGLFVTQMFPITMLLIPLFLMLAKLGLIDGYTGLIIVYTATAIPFNIWMIKGYFDTIPRSLEESAYVDGCTTWQAFFIIMLPLAKPAIALCALFSFMGAWSEYLVAAAVLRNAGLKTLPVGLVSLQGEFSTEWGVYSAIALVTAIPVMVVFISLSKYLVGGLSSGAVKE
jgi:arabinogalactan oligomer / maltooligosaccharide transport system permease protein